MSRSPTVSKWTSVLQQPFSNLTGTTAVVTGAAGGIGAAMTEALCELGGTVIAVDIDTRALQASQTVIPVSADVSMNDGTNEIVDAVRRSGRRLSLWMNNAAVISRERALDITIEDFDRLMDVNVRAAFLGARAAHGLMAPHGDGTVVNVASINATRVQKERSVYGTTKGALVTLTRYLGAEWGPSGVRVNAVAPGYVDTPMSVWHRLDADGRDQLLSSVPLGRLAQPADIVAMVLFLSSPLAEYVTGQTFHVDGGFTL
jgi:NAD(P)-dependent dehydrogenase (short-subunit alcohol dehydrogenase family)